MKKIIAIAALSAALTTSAFAADNTAYVTAGLGSVTYKNAGAFTNPGNFELGIGYTFTPTLAAELSYHKFGDSTLANAQTGASATVSVSSITAAVVGSYPINEQVSLLGKIGFASNKWDLTSNVGVSGNGSKTSLYYALGGEYNINQNYAVRAQYEDFGDISSGTNPLGATAFGVSAVVKF
jgi:opacity protein-like surface antigen